MWCPDKGSQSGCKVQCKSLPFRIHVCFVLAKDETEELVTNCDRFRSVRQNPTLTVKTTGVFHDRFLILDGKELYHFGASLKDLGRHYCAVSKMDAMFIPSIMERI